MCKVANIRIHCVRLWKKIISRANIGLHWKIYVRKISTLSIRDLSCHTMWQSYLQITLRCRVCTLPVTINCNIWVVVRLSYLSTVKPNSLKSITKLSASTSVPVRLDAPVICWNVLLLMMMNLPRSAWSMRYLNSSKLSLYIAWLLTALN